LDIDFTAGNFCDSAAPLAEKDAAARPELLGHIVYFFL
jgi:hypothetical protein